MSFVVKFEVHMFSSYDEVFECHSKSMKQEFIPAFIQAITEAGHTLVEVCRIEDTEEDSEDYEEEIVVEENWDDDDPDLEICEDN